MLEIKINELRVGNYVGIAEFMNFKIVQVSEIRKERILVESKVGIFSSKNHKIIPIELTEELLLKCGFERVFTNDYWYQIRIGDKRLLVSILGNIEIEKWDRTMINFLSICQYIHQLQNLFFSLTGEELVFSSTEP